MLIVDDKCLLNKRTYQKVALQLCFISKCYKYFKLLEAHQLLCCAEILLFECVDVFSVLFVTMKLTYLGKCARYIIAYSKPGTDVFGNMEFFICYKV